MSTSVARQERRAAQRAAENRSEGAALSITADSANIPQTDKLPAVAMIYGTTMSVLCGEYDIQGLHLPDGATVLDIGANEGAFCAWALYRFPGSKIVAYEPCRATFETLKSVMSNQTRVTLINAAVTEREKPFLRYGVNCNQENSIYDLGTQRQEGETVETVKPFDLPKADFVKIDTEGCEVEILRAYLNKHQPAGIALEWHSSQDRDALRAILFANGYAVTEIPNVPVCIAKGVYIGVMKGVKL